jgi:mono/diheme cytochrome c family protein
MKRALLFLPPLLALAGGLAIPARGDTPGGVDSKNKAVEGAKIYKQICAACHMPNAMGSGAGAIPALAKNRKLANPAYPIGILMKGKGAMPPMSEMLTPAQIAAVLTYVRTNFGNAYPQPITDADVKRLGK